MAAASKAIRGLVAMKHGQTVSVCMGFCLIQIKIRLDTDRLSRELRRLRLDLIYYYKIAFDS